MHAVSLVTVMQAKGGRRGEGLHSAATPLLGYQWHVLCSNPCFAGSTPFLGSGDASNFRLWLLLRDVNFAATLLQNISLPRALKA